MTRQFIAALLSLSIGAGAMTTAPARADDDVVKVIAGLAVLGIIANSIKHNEQKKHVRREVVTQRQNRSHVEQRRQHVSKRNTNRHVNRQPARVRHTKVAPSTCLREQWTHRGTRNVYSARCMQRNARQVLPRSCKRQVETRRGVRQFYTPNCLRKHGWRA